MVEHKTNWNYGDTISADDVNRWEQYLKEIRNNEYYNDEYYNIDADDGSKLMTDFWHGGIYTLIPTDTIKVRDMPDLFDLTIPCVLIVRTIKKGEKPYCMQELKSFDGKVARRTGDNSGFGKWQYEGVINTTKQDNSYEVNVIALADKFLVDIYIENLETELLSKYTYGKLIGNVGFRLKRTKRFNVVTMDTINTTSNQPQYVTCEITDAGDITISRIYNQEAITDVHLSCVIGKYDE